MSTSSISRILHVRTAVDELDWRHVRSLLGADVNWIHQPDGRAELERMYSIPAARGSGLAGRLLDTAVGEALRHGDRSIWLETAHGVMDAAIALYRRHGLRHCGNRPRTGIDHPDLVVMELDLRTAP